MNNKVKGWSGEAFNQVPDSDNRIHSDEVAKAYGFTGALVPGVTVSTYLIHPAVEAWGNDWLERGYAHARVQSPLYDHARFDVEVTEAEDQYHGELKSEGRLCAVADVLLPRAAPPAPAYRGDSRMSDDHLAPTASRESMESLRKSGCPAKTFLWSAEHEMATYLRKQSQMSAPLRTDGSPQAGGFANPSFLLGCANRHFAAVAKMSPWIHLETKSQNYAAVPMNMPLISEMTIVDLFEKKGHEFADCVFNIFRDDTKECVFSVEQRAIYRMRET
ncbi:hypothetical protein F6455_14085 [Proteobacteria bacterium 005FR1]|nr:hypothetical protein [Proteobacteria bacterium 005FR1]